MTMKRQVIEAFKGQSLSQPVVVSVRFKDKKRQIYVDFGELRIPKYGVSIDPEKLEKKFECRIVEAGNSWIVYPKKAVEIIKKEGVLCSATERHVKAMEEWFEKHGVKLIGTFLGYEED